MEVLDAARIRRADEIAIEDRGIPGLVLMETAGRLAAEVFVEEGGLHPRQRIVILCGRGNNGGDGFVAGRHLRQWGFRVELFLVGARLKDLTGDAQAMARAFIGAGEAVVELPDLESWRASQPALGPEDAVLDALFGTGLSRPLAGFAAEVVNAVNHSGAFVCAVDLPSGLLADSAHLEGPVIQADLTVTFARPKPALLLPPAEECCGDLVVVDIGIPDEVIRETRPDLHWVTAQDAALLLPEREADDHKGHFGHVLVVAGSIGKAGAAALTGWGAVRAGAGLVTVAAPSIARPEIAGFAAELMTEPLPATRQGFLARGAATRALALARERTVLAVGPGLGQAPPVPAEIRRLVLQSPVPLVLDADGLNAFVGQKPRLFRKAKAPLVITPHPGEAARLMNVTAAEIQAARLEWARKIAAETGAITVLKGYRSLVASPAGPVFINPTGNPGMASGGMGDVLTGMIAGMIAQGLEPLDAALLAVFLHGLAADLALDDGETEPTLTAGAVLKHLPAAFRKLDQPDEDEGGAGAGEA